MDLGPRSVRTAVAAPLFSLAAILLLCACGPSASEVAAETARAQAAAVPHALITTAFGEIEIEFFPTDSPKAVENFQLLTQRGYYNGLTFHRVQPGFMIQGGDPKGDGTGGESAWGKPFEDNIDRRSPLYRKNYLRGIVAMANSGRDTNGSQFFIMHKDYLMAPQYVIFGKVVRGMEVVDKIVEAPTKRGSDRQMSMPITPVVMQTVTLLPVSSLPPPTQK